MDLAAAAPGRLASRFRGRSPWFTAHILVALLVAAPLLMLPASFVGQGRAVDQIASGLLPDALRASVVLAAGVGAGTLILGTALAALVSFYEFPGRRWLEWALILPLAMPAYVLVFVLLGQYDFSSPLQRGVRELLGADASLPDIRSTGGTIGLLTLVLYPYVYVLARGAFLSQSRETLEAAQTLGLSHGRAIVRVAVPLARPALAGGVTLAVMEALADFGAVNLLGYQAMTDAIYRVWYGTFDRAAGLQLASVLVGLTLTLLLLERVLRGRARYDSGLTPGDAVAPRRLHGARAALAVAAPSGLLLLVIGAPVGQLLAWSADSLIDGRAGADLLGYSFNSLGLATIAALITVAIAAVLGYARRARPTRTAAVATRVASLGYAVPGTVVAVAVYVPLSWTERRLSDASQSLLSIDTGLVLTGTVIGLLFAYVVRFYALALLSVEARMARIDVAYDEAARSLGASRSRVLSQIHLPLLWPGIVTAGLLVFVEVMKELPATALLRPLGGDTLAIAVWDATKESRFDAAALPALLIVLVGMIPVILLVRLTRRDQAAGPM